VQKKAFSDVCDEHGIQPSLFHGRQKQLFDGIEAVLAGKATSRATAREDDLRRQNQALKTKLGKKDAVVAQLSEEIVTLTKRELGEP
jgi:transposase-like protein